MINGKYMNILVVNRDPIERIPPLISVILLLSELGNNVTVVTTGISNENKKLFSLKGVKLYVNPYKLTKSFLIKIINVFCYRHKLKKILKHLNVDLVWVEGAGTFRTAKGIFDKYNFVMQISELYDYPEAKPVRKAIKKLIHKAKVVVMPEVHRAMLYQKLYSLNDLPFVLPNKPYFYLSDDKYVECKNKYKDYLKIFDQKKVILYQGIIAKERDLSNYIKAIKEIKKEYQLVLLGSDYGMVEKYRLIDPDLIHIDFIPAPDYLVFTAHAHIGLLSYDGSTLNCAYCAPNKLYEYGKYGLPMLGNNIPGLKNTIGTFNAGVIADETSVESIKKAILKIDANYEFYSENSLNLFNNTDNLSKMKDILNFFRNKINGSK